MTQYTNEYGTTYAVREYKGKPQIMCRAKDSSDWLVSGTLAVEAAAADTLGEMQEVLDEYARAHGWKKAAPEKTKEDYSPCEGCRCPDCDDEACPQAHCDKSDKGLGCIAPDGLCPPVNPTDAAADAPPCAPTVSDAQPLPSPNADAGAKTGANGEVAACACYGCKRSDCTCAGGRDVFGRSDCDGHCNCSQSECTHDIRHRANPTPAAPASPADAGDAASVAIPAASPVATPSNLPAFDYSGLDAQTVQDLHLAEREVAGGRRMAEIGLRRMADGVAIAHDALCVTDATNCRNGDGTFSAPEKTFGLWCDSVGLNRKAAERLLQVSKLFDNSTPREQKVLEELGPSLLYAAAKPSAPAELVQAVKDRDITTHKQYQEALAEIRARDAKIADLLDMSEAADRRADKAEQTAKDTARERDAALRRAAEAEKQRDGARDALTASKLRGDKLKAENEALKARPIEARVVDEEEINRRAQARADELTAPMREELEALRARHPADLEEAEQAIRDAYDSAIYTGRVMENAWHTLRPLLPRMDAHRRELAINQVSKTLSQIQGEIAACL